MRRARLKASVTVLVSASVLLLAACSSSGGGSTASSWSTASAGSTGKFPNGTLTVGLMTSLTGVSAPTYTDTEAGVQMAFSTINAAGGVNGQQLKFVAADDQSTAAGAFARAPARSSSGGAAPAWQVVERLRAKYSAPVRESAASCPGPGYSRAPLPTKAT